jgi:cytidyltransferase-like protein
MKKIFVSGCYDILHAGHIQFFEEARALGDYLIVSFASSEVLWHHKKRRASIPDEHKKVLLESLRMVDQVIVGKGMKLGRGRFSERKARYSCRYGRRFIWRH